MKRTKAALAAAALALLPACATTYTAENFAEYQAKHETVAVLPFITTIDRRNLKSGYDPEALSDAERAEAYQFQNRLYVQFLDRSEKGDYTVAFQPIDRTNVLMERAGIGYDDLRAYTRDEIGAVLGVDAVISGEIRRSQPVGTGAAVASAFLVGAASPTNVVTVTMSVHDAETGQLVWAYDHAIQGSLGSSSEGIARSLMRNSASKFPYTREED